MTQKKTRLQTLIQRLNVYAHRIWYPYLLGLLCLLDNFLIFIPNDALLISSSILTPKRWHYLAVVAAIFSTIGAYLLYVFIHQYGPELLFKFYPSIPLSKTWSVTEKFFEQYGTIVIFIVAVTPIMQHPVIIIASMTNSPALNLVLAIFTGRTIKFLIMAYLASHAPAALSKMWGLKKEIKHIPDLNKKE